MGWMEAGLSTRLLTSPFPLNIVRLALPLSLPQSLPPSLHVANMWDPSCRKKKRSGNVRPSVNNCKSTGPLNDSISQALNYVCSWLFFPIKTELAGWLAGREGLGGIVWDVNINTGQRVCCSGDWGKEAGHRLAGRQGWQAGWLAEGLLCGEYMTNSAHQWTLAL